MIAPECLCSKVTVALVECKYTSICGMRNTAHSEAIGGSMTHLLK